MKANPLPWRLLFGGTHFPQGFRVPKTRKNNIVQGLGISANEDFGGIFALRAHCTRTARYF